MSLWLCDDFHESECLSSVSLCLYLCSVFPQVRRFNLCLIWSSHSSTHTCFHIPPPILHVQSVCHAELFHSWGNEWKHELAWETWKVHSVLNTPGFTFTVIWPLSSLPFFCYYLYIYMCVCERLLNSSDLSLHQSFHAGNLLLVFCGRGSINAANITQLSIFI